jgi:hypothetical protein
VTTVVLFLAVAVAVAVGLVLVVGGERFQRIAWALLSNLRRSERMWNLVETTGIVVFVGPNGSGKSLAAVNSCLIALRGVPWYCDQLAHHHNDQLRDHIEHCSDGCDRGTQVPTALCELGRLEADASMHGTRLVYSTVPLLGDDGEPHELYRPLVDFRQLVTIEHADVLFDEVAGVSDASDSSGVPVQVTNWLHQLRKRDCRLRVTTPAYARCSKPIRQVAQLVVDARSFFAEPSTSGRLWRPRRAMLFRAFDAFAFEDYTASVSKGDRVKAMAGAAFWRPGSEAARRYDTLGAVVALGHVTEGGMCAVCGGARSRPRCACDHSVDDVAADRIEVEESVTSSGSRVRKARVLDVVRPEDAKTEVLPVVNKDQVAGAGELDAGAVRPEQRRPSPGPRPIRPLVKPIGHLGERRT